MKNNTDSLTVLQIIGHFVAKAAAKGDTADMLEHLAVYMAALKASKAGT